jgi:hypothetical protein
MLMDCVVGWQVGRCHINNRKLGSVMGKEGERRSGANGEWSLLRREIAV